MTPENRPRFPLFVLLAFVTGCLLAAPTRSQVDEARDAYNFAAGLFDKGLHERAARAFESFLAEHPGDRRRGKALFYLGQSLVELDQPAKALARFQEQLALGGDELRRECRFRAAEMQHRLGQNREAVAALQKLLGSEEVGDLRESALYLLAESARAAGDPALAEQSFAALIALAPEGQYAAWAESALGFSALEKGEVAAARGHFEKAAGATDKGLALEARIMIGECTLRGGEAATALEIFDRLRRNREAAADFRVPLGYARALLAAGRVDDAVAAFRAAAKAHPDQPEVLRAMIRAAAQLQEKGQAKAGLELLAETPAAEGQDAKDLAYWRGLLAAGTGSLDEGIAQLTAAVAAGGGPQRKFSLADALSRAGRHEEAAALFAEVSRESEDAKVKSEARFAEAYAWNRAGKSERALPLLAGLDKDGIGEDLRADAVFAIAENLFALGRHEEALRHYARLEGAGAERHGNDALYKKGWCEYLLGRHDQAIESFEALAARDPAAAWIEEIGFLVGKCHEAMGRDGPAREAFEKAAKGKNAGLRQKSVLGAAAAALKGGDRDAARRNYERLTRDDVPAELRGEAWFQLAELDHAEGKLDEAVRGYSRLVTTLPDHARGSDAALALAWTLRELGRHEEAALAARELAGRAADPRIKGEALHLGALEAIAASRFEEALQLADQIEPLPGEHPRSLESRLVGGIAAARLGRHDEARRRLEVVAAKGHGQTLETALYELAFVREALGDGKGRDECLRRLLEEAPEGGYARDARFRLAEALYAAGDFAAAAEGYEKVASAEGDPALRGTALYKRAWCERKRERHAEAATAFEAAAADEKHELAAESTYLAGDEWCLAGRLEDAERCFAVMIRRHARHEFAKPAALRRLTALEGLGRHEEVVRAAGVLQQGDGDDAFALEARSAVADAFAALGQWGRARTLYRGLTKATEGPLAARAQYSIGRSFAAEGDAEHAIDEYLKVGILYAHREWAAKATLAAADLLLEAKDLEKARKLLSEVVKSWPEREESKSAAAKLAEIGGVK